MKRRTHIPLPKLTRKQKREFWSRVDKDPNLGLRGDCWYWKGRLNLSGYGKHSINGADLGAHRLSYFIHTGDDPGGLFICHSCDNPQCVNPSHLWKGTQKDNMADSAQKGRMNMHESPVRANEINLLTQKQRMSRMANEIRKKLEDWNYTIEDASMEFGFSPTVIKHLLSKGVSDKVSPACPRVKMPCTE